VLVGRVLRGMELLSSLPRGGGALGFYTDKEKARRALITRARLAADLPEAERTALEVLRTDTPLFTKYVEARRNRRESWFLRPAGHTDVCNISIPVRDVARAVHEHGYVKIGGIEQWVAIDGASNSNPVILSVHGGPGNPISPFIDQLYGAWQQSFTVATWDQRFSGRTYARNEPVVELTEERIAATSLTLEQLVDDGIEVAEHLRKRLGKPRLILTGGSWGSVIAVHMAHRRPDLFYAYVGVSQLVNERDNLAASYAAMLAAAKNKQDAAAIATLQELGPPPWTNPRNFGRMRRIMRAYETAATTAAPEFKFAPEYSSDEYRAAYEAGEELSFVKYVGMKGDGMARQVDLPKLGRKYQVPVFLVQGEQDLLTTADITRRWYESIEAPRKKLVMVPGAGHDPNFAMLDAELRVIREEVLPLTK
jgi:pimeloyl-ACP methyl ester carboxylesterase